MINSKSQRVVPLDLARFLAMVMMIQGHTIFALASPEAVDPNTFPWNWWNFLRGFTAPAFLIISGVSHVFANKRDEFGNLSSKTIIKRIRMSVILIVIGYLLHFPAERIWDIFYVGKDNWTFFFQVNILQLIGVTLLLLLSLFLITKNDKQLGVSALAIALVITFISPLIQTIKWFGIMPEFIAAYISAERTTIFPIFPFSAFVFYGAAFGTLLKQFSPEGRIKFLLSWGFPIGIGIFAIGYVVEELTNGGFSLYMPMSNIGLTLLRVGSVMFGLPVITFIYLKTHKLGQYYSMFSKKALFIYVAHLLVIYGAVIFPGLYRLFPNALSLPQAFLAVIFVEVIAIFSAWFYEYSLKKYNAAPILYKFVVGAYLLIALVI